MSDARDPEVTEIRDAGIAIILESVRVNGRAKTALHGAELAVDALMRAGWRPE